MRRIASCLLPALAPILLLVGRAPMASEASGSQDELKPGTGRELVLDYCTACHTTEMITAAHMSLKSWDATLVWMQQTQGLGEIPAADRSRILDYLDETQGLDDLDADEQSPWAEPLYRPNPIWPD